MGSSGGGYHTPNSQKSVNNKRKIPTADKEVPTDLFQKSIVGAIMLL